MKSMFISLLIAVFLTTGCSGLNEFYDTFKYENFDKPKEIEAEKQQQERVLAELTSKAQSGDAEAQFELGTKYLDGDGVQKSTNQALKWLTESADNNHIGANGMLYMMYLAGEGVGRNTEKAKYYFKRSVALLTPKADAGDAFSAGNLAMLYETKGDSANAEKYYMIAAEGGDKDAQYTLGKYYLYGTFNTNSQFFVEGLHSKKNSTKAIPWLTKAADAGHADAQFELGKAYEYGYGTSKDPVKSHKYYLLSAQGGNIEAYCPLAYIYYSGNGVTPDLVEAHMFVLLKPMGCGYSWQNTIYGKLNENERKEAQSRAIEWKRQYK